MAPTPSLSGHPVIIGEICSYLAQHELSRMLCVDKQTYEIAGQKLFQHLVITPRTVAPLISYKTVVSRVRKSATRQMRPPNRLLNYVETLDITEESLVSISQAYADGRIPFAPLPRLETMIIRADPDADPLSSGRCVHHAIGEGLQPKLLVVVGDVAALYRILSYRRNGSDGGTRVGFATGLSHMRWPSVLRLHHILPYENPYPYPGDFILRAPDSQITASLPNLRRFDFFFDLNRLERVGKYDADSRRADSHFLRSVAWLIRHTHPSLPMTIWLASETQSVFLGRLAFIKHMVHRPATFGAVGHIVWSPGHFVEWSEPRLSKRLATVEGRFCGRETESNWRGAVDGKKQYDPAFLHEVKGRSQVAEGADGAGGHVEKDIAIVEVLWDKIIANDPGDEQDFTDGEEEDEEEEEESSEESDDSGDLHGRPNWNRGGYSRNQPNWAKQSFEDEDGDGSEEDEDDI